jgi:5-formyltetrahydrofolate cyclo-ligase
MAQLYFLFLCMKKSELRKIYRDKRLSLTENERSRLDDLMLIQFQKVELPFIHALLSYWPIEENNEPNTHLFTEFLKFRNPEMITAYPVSDFSSLAMDAIATDIDTPFRKTELNIHEPEKGDVILAKRLDMVFVPLLVVDKQGYRIGYGKGFYDKYLGSCRDNCIKAGFSYFEPVDTISDKEDFDLPLDLCITPQAVYVF